MVTVMNMIISSRHNSISKECLKMISIVIFLFQNDPKKIIINLGIYFCQLYTSAGSNLK